MFDALRTAPTPRLARVLGVLLAIATGAPAALAAPRPDGPPKPTPIQWTARAERHVAEARERTLAACKERGIELPAAFLAWIDADPVRCASVYGCRQDPLPVLVGLRALELDLGEQTVRRDYPQLALAFAIQGSYRAPSRKASDWNDEAGGAATPLPDVSPRPLLQLVIPGDPRGRVDTRAKDRELDRDDHIVNFLEDHAPIEVEVKVRKLPPLEYDDKGVARPRGKAATVIEKQQRKPFAADVIASAALQQEFNAYMKAHGEADVEIDCGDRAVHWYASDAVRDKAQRTRIRGAFELFRDAYRAKGRLPMERDPAPTPSESMAWFVRNDRHPFSDADRKARQWPRFPLGAPWPVLLMLAADDQPLREREEIWVKFRDAGEMRTYGEYIGGIAQQFDMQSARRLSPFAFYYGSIQMMWKDGGVCGTMGNIGARTWRICGVPASTAGQPGHCALVRMQHDPKTGDYSCRGDQYATGGDEVTTVHAGWNYDDKGGRRGMVFHQTVAWGVNRGLQSFVETLVMHRAFAALDPEQRTANAIGLVKQGLAHNPFALPLVDAAVGSLDGRALVRLLDVFDAALAKAMKPGEYPLYRATVRDLVHARIARLDPPTSRAQHAALLRDLERQGCQDAGLLARTWRALDGEKGFDHRCAAAVKDYLASPARAKDRREPARFAKWLGALGKSVAKKRRKAWAEALLGEFAGHEALVVRRKRTLDPAVAALCKIAGRPTPKL